MLVYCKCNYRYMDDSYILSICPNCGRRNWHINTDLPFFILITILCIAILLGMIFGSIALILYARNQRYFNYWYAIGSISLSIFSIYGFFDAYNDLPILSTSIYIFNSFSSARYFHNLNCF